VSGLADWATGDVHAGQSQDASGGRLIGWGRRGRFGVEHGTNACQGCALVPSAQPTEVADFGEAAGKDVEQKAGQELVGGEFHRLELVLIGAVAPGERDLTILQRQDAVVGDGHAVGVAGEVVEGVLGPGYGSLRITIQGHFQSRSRSVVQPVSVAKSAASRS